jgi:hypothetical protein
MMERQDREKERERIRVDKELDNEMEDFERRERDTAARHLESLARDIRGTDGKDEWRDKTEREKERDM